MSATLTGHGDLLPASGDDPVPSETGDTPFGVHVHYAGLLDSFRQFLFELGGNPVATDSLALELCREEYTRLTVWGVQNRASSLPDTHGSLSGALAELPELGGLVVEILEDTRTRLLQILPVASSCDAASLEISRESDSESGISTSSDSDMEPSTEKPSTQLGMVFGNIDELYRLQSLLRKHRLKGRYLHSSRSYGNLPGYQQDYQHVIQKFESWARDSTAKSKEEEADEKDRSQQILDELDDQPAQSMDDVLQRQKIEDDSSQVKDILCRRFAAANSKRRKQLRYWETHPYREARGDDGVLLGAKMPIRSAPGAAERAEPDDFDNRIPKSVKAPTTVHTFSTAPRSAIFPEVARHAQIEVARTIYEPSLVGNSPQATIRVPGLPLVAEGENTITCPYCYMTLDVEAMQSRDDWKRHVFRDLRPYVCTATNCSDPDKQYATRYDWIYHESQVHHRQWECADCTQVLDSKAAFIIHTSRDHEVHWNDRQVTILADMRERARDDAAWSVCPFCSYNLQQHKLLKHMANHMEEISLFALPKLFENNVEVNSDAAHENEAADSRDCYLEEWKSVSETQPTGAIDDHGSLDLQSVEPEQQALVKPPPLSEDNELSSPKEEVGRMQQYPTTKEEYQNQDEREELVVSKQEVRGQALGVPNTEDHDFLLILRTTASNLEDQGDYAEAEQTYRKMIELGTEALGATHPEILSGMDNLALVLRDLEKYEEAETIHRETLKLREEVIGAKHPNTLSSMNNLALVLRDLEKYEEAETIHRETLKLREEVLGATHPDTLFSMRTLASVLCALGKYEEAERISEEEERRLRREALQA